MLKFSNLMLNEGNKNHGFSDNAHLETHRQPFPIKILNQVFENAENIRLAESIKNKGSA